MLTELLLSTLTQIISTLGYAGIFVLMAAESTFLPVPSEGVLPFAGYLIAQGQLNLYLVILIATLGTILGSLISYYIGKYFGKKIVLRYGKYFLVNKKEVELAEKWFEKYGTKTIFVCRFIPVIRHVISIPAGTAQMKRRKFITYTALGGLIWNSILVFAGITLEKNWELLLNYTSILDPIIIVLIILGIVWFWRTHLKNK
ncbi:MAG: DedA family protein [archaeon]|jgi:membrane protein DedA with SNARE-associated domain